MKKIKKTTGQVKHDQNKREFLKKSTIVGAGILAATAVPTAALADVADKTPDTAQQKGYHVTQHVIDYYKSAAI